MDQKYIDDFSKPLLKWTQKKNLEAGKRECSLTFPNSPLGLCSSPPSQRGNWVFIDAETGT